MTVQADTAKSGTCGDSITWKVSDKGTLTLSGSGEMYDYAYSGGYFPAEVPWRVNDKVRKSIKKIVISSGITYLGDYAFCELPNLSSVSIPNTVQSFGEGIFYNDRKLNNVTIPSGVTSIPKSMFRDCTSLSKLSVPESVTYIGESAFENTALTKFSFPKGLTVIEYNTFAFSALTSAVIPEGVTTIHRSAFESCCDLKTVTLPDSLQEIHATAFFNVGLTTVTIPKNVSAISANAFESCDELKNVFFTGDAPNFSPSTFNNVKATAYYPKNNSTWTADVKKNYAGRIKWVSYTPFVITLQPQSTTVAHGEKATVTVNAEGDGLKYQWYYAAKGAKKFKKASITKATYSVAMNTERDGRQLYCVVKDKYGKSVKTEVVTINLEKTPLQIVTQPVNGTAAYGKKAAVTVEAQGDGLTYQWYYAAKGAKKFKKASITKATYSVSMDMSREGRQLYCVVKDIYGNSVKTDTVTISIERKELSIVTQPVSVSVKNGKKANVTVVAEGDGLTYQWYYAAKGSKKFKKASITKATYSVEMDKSRNGRQLYCVVKDAYGNSVKTDVVTISKQ